MKRTPRLVGYAYGEMTAIHILSLLDRHGIDAAASRLTEKEPCCWAVRLVDRSTDDVSDQLRRRLHAAWYFTMARRLRAPTRATRSA